MVAFARVVYIALLPSMLIGAVLAVVWRRVGVGPWRTALQVLAALFLLVPQPLVLLLGSYSAELRPYQQLLFALIGLGIAVLCVLSWRAYPRPERRHRIGLMAGGVFIAGVGVYLGGTAVGDYLLPHHQTIGRVVGTQVVHHGRAPDSYRVLIDGRSYDITLDLLAGLHRGDLVEADVGAATGTILRIRHRADSTIGRGGGR